jgi:NAD(P)-dependent dehydrogenase (short-subunit alcohol dehydrogenase family)
MEKKAGGAIVNLSSIVGLRMSAERAHVAYSTAKYGILAFSKSTAIEFAKKSIRCNTVIPGLMNTPLVEQRLAKTVARGDLAALIAKRDAAVPVGHMGTAWDVAHAVLFLVSDEARYITGTEIVVDGGMSAAGMG